MRKLKLIWDFRGPSSQKVAEHHEIHLKEYISTNNINVHKTGVENLNELHSLAYLLVDEIDMKPIRDSLKPHRGQVYSE